MKILKDLISSIPYLLQEGSSRKHPFPRDIQPGSVNIKKKPTITILSRFERRGSLPFNFLRWDRILTDIIVIELRF